MHFWILHQMFTQLVHNMTCHPLLHTFFFMLLTWMFCPRPTVLLPWFNEMDADEKDDWLDWQHLGRLMVGCIASNFCHNPAHNQQMSKKLGLPMACRYTTPKFIFIFIFGMLWGKSKVSSATLHSPSPSQSIPLRKETTPKTPVVCKVKLNLPSDPFL